MMDNLLKIHTLAERFLAAETTLEEERELVSLCRDSRLPADLLPLREMVLGLESIAIGDDEQAMGSGSQPSPGAELAAASLDISAKGAKPAAATRRWLAVAAAIVVVLVGGAALLWHQQQDECVAYIYGKRCTDRAVVMREMQQSMADMAADDADVEGQLSEMFSTN